MKRNLTLAIEESLIQRARMVAVKRHRSLTDLIREYLERLATDDDQRAQALRRLKKEMTKRSIQVGSRSWSRDELHER